jgi:hypothetical protein
VVASAAAAGFTAAAATVAAASTHNVNTPAPSAFAIAAADFPVVDVIAATNADVST